MGPNVSFWFVWVSNCNVCCWEKNIISGLQGWHYLVRSFWIILKCVFFHKISQLAGEHGQTGQHIVCTFPFYCVSIRKPELALTTYGVLRNPKARHEKYFKRVIRKMTYTFIQLLCWGTWDASPSQCSGLNDGEVKWPPRGKRGSPTGKL